ncbi:hypothetical protein C1H46_016587 [Malus baccata]|uniref:Uncharacterized protein n=1 Tax=Malus baccata TaxID=106549 RepID=A0A540MGC2_MALBA|nr:hypothetical protein C1H46_016587 [Malus baccata]
MPVLLKAVLRKPLNSFWHRNVARHVHSRLDKSTNKMPSPSTVDSFGIHSINHKYDRSKAMSGRRC